MPNWAFNRLEVSGDRADLERFMAENRTDESDLSFSARMPMPPELEGIISGQTIIDGQRFSNWREIDGVNVGVEDDEIQQLLAQHGATNWYDWNTRNWGTKWDIRDAEMDDGGDLVSYRFDTAWSPPVKWFANLVPLYPSLEFRLLYAEEQGSAFAGCVYASGGLITQHDEWTGDDAARFAYEEFGYESSVTCPICSGHGTVSGGLLDDTEVECVECNGEGYVDFSTTLGD